MKISALNGYSLNNINFEARRKKEVDTPVHKASPAKAVPLALLIAMSPVNAQIPTGPRTAHQTESITRNEKEIKDKFPFKNATPEGTDGLITVYDSENNEQTIEVRLNKHIRSYAIDVNNNVIDAYRLKEVDIVPEELYSKIETRTSVNGHQTTKKVYYVIGSGTECTYPPQALDKNIKVIETSHPIIGDFSHQKYEISEDLYKYLKKILNGKIAINEERNSTLVIEGRKR